MLLDSSRREKATKKSCRNLLTMAALTCWNNTNYHIGIPYLFSTWPSLFYEWNCHGFNNVVLAFYCSAFLFFTGWYDLRRLPPLNLAVRNARGSLPYHFTRFTWITIVMYAQFRQEWRFTTLSKHPTDLITNTSVVLERYDVATMSGHVGEFETRYPSQICIPPTDFVL